MGGEDPASSLLLRYTVSLGVCRINAKPSDSPDDFSHFGDDFRGLTDLRKRKSLEFRDAYPTF
jgi:hypothetical protein